MSKKPKRPYLLRALYDWIVDSELTPYVLVNANADGVSRLRRPAPVPALAGPPELVVDGRLASRQGDPRAAFAAVSMCFLRKSSQQLEHPT